MGARDDIRRYVSLLGDWWTPKEVTDQRTEKVYEAVRAEVLTEAVAVLGAETFWFDPRDRQSAMQALLGLTTHNT